MFDLAIYYRMVGGFCGYSGPNATTWARLRWALTMGGYMAFAALVHHQPILELLEVFLGASAGAFLGRLIPHAAFQSKASPLNALAMSAINVVRVALIIAPYAYFDPWRMTLTLGGLWAGIAYYVGNKYLTGKDSGIYFRNTDAQWRIAAYAQAYGTSFLDQAAVGGSEWGELLTGLLVYQIMFAAALVLP